jgi:hypothetical protein
VCPVPKKEGNGKFEQVAHMNKIAQQPSIYTKLFV